MQNPDEIWQVEVKGEIYDTTFAELTVWIAENSLLESDNVRRGELRWLEAGKVPPLAPFFTAKANGTPPPVLEASVSVPEPGEEILPEGVTDSDQTQDSKVPAPKQQATAAEEINSTICNIHPDRASVFTCDACHHGFCKACPQSFGSSVKICPYCGGMCRSNKETNAAGEFENRIQRDITTGFGFGDLGTAIGYPFRYKFSLVCGGIMIGVLGYGQTAAATGSFFMIGAAIICFILSTAIIFGMVSNTLNNFAKGDIDRNFMSGMDDFSAWDDVVHPFFLFLGTFISSFGLAAVIAIGMVWYTVSSIKSQATAQPQQFIELAKESAQSAEHVNRVREKLIKQNQGLDHIETGEDGLTDSQRSTINEEAEFQRVSDLANNYRKDQLESTIGKTPDAQRVEMQATAVKMLQSAGIFILLFALAMLWGFFYFPAACAVAGYTRSFWAAANPLVGLDTIKHMGFDYVKILVMNIIIGIVSGLINLILAVIFAPLDLPGFGNIPAKFVASFVGFYFWIVFAVLIGLALYKNSDKLKLYR